MCAPADYHTPLYIPCEQTHWWDYLQTAFVFECCSLFWKRFLFPFNVYSVCEIYIRLCMCNYYSYAPQIITYRLLGKHLITKWYSYICIHSGLLLHYIVCLSYGRIFGLPRCALSAHLMHILHLSICKQPWRSRNCEGIRCSCCNLLTHVMYLQQFTQMTQAQWKWNAVTVMMQLRLLARTRCICNC